MLRGKQKKSQKSRGTQTENNFKMGREKLLMTGQWQQRPEPKMQRAAERSSSSLLMSLHPMVSVAKSTPHYGSLGFFIMAGCVLIPR